jgi:DNA-binding response OmpR family regulator
VSEPAPRLLLVEDEALIRETFVRYLRACGWEVRGVDSAEEALRLAAAEPFAAVLLDNVLTGATGMTALPRLVELTKAPVLMMTGYADDEFDKDARLLGARAVLRKPLDPADADRELRAAAGL